MAKKVKKPSKKKKIQKKIDKGKTRAEYEEEIVELNRELAAFELKFVGTETLQRRVLDAYEAVRDNFFSIKEGLQGRIQIEDYKLQASLQRLAWLENHKKTQIEQYEKIIKDLEEDTENSTRGAKDTIENKKITLRILEHFDDQREVYVKEEAKIAEAEKNMVEMCKRDWYELDRKIRADEAPLRAEAEKQLSTVFEPLLLRTEPAGLEISKILMSEENRKLEGKIENDMCRLLKLCEEFDRLLKIEWFLKLEIGIQGDEQKENKIKEPENENIVTEVVKTEDKATQTKNQVVVRKPEMDSTLTDIENLVQNLKVVDDKEEYFEQQFEVFEKIHGIIEPLLEKPKNWYIAGGIDFKRQPKPNRIKLFRPTLYRNLHVSKKNLHQNIFKN